MQLLAAVEADGTNTLLEVLVGSVGRLRRGMTAIVVSPSLESAWVRPLATLRSRGVGCVIVTLDAAAAERSALDEHARLAGLPPYAPDGEVEDRRAQRARALRHALAEYELPTYHLTPGRPLGEVLVS
jgi:hypothetical protein